MDEAVGAVEVGAGAAHGAAGDGSAAEARRAHTLQRLLPALVHRLNNALAVAQLVHDLGDEADPEERARAGMELGTLRSTLERLALHSQPDPGPVRLRGDEGALFRALELLFRPLANSQRIELELRSQSMSACADLRLEGLLLDLCVALAEGRGPTPGARHRLRLAAESAAGEVRLRLAAVAFQATVAERAALDDLAELARRSGWSFARRRGARGLALRLGLPAPDALPALRPSARPRARRVLLLHGAGAVREELAMLLREAGHTVTEASEEPRQGAFDLALLERGRTRDDLALFARLQAGFARRVEWLVPGLSPGELLRRVQA